ncbi:MAG TPA: hypothetical protein VFE36_10020, partial [Candidatus Baltobacteraceae bacterium]|nr:hypothetical protein [Candidatus Baltobacteraceae bacterium]
MKKTFLTLFAAFVLSACAGGSHATMPGIPGADAVSTAANRWNVKTLANGWSGPFAIAFDGAGNAFVTDDDQNALFEVPRGGTIRKIATGLSNPTSVAADAVGDAFVSYDAGVREFLTDGTSRKISIPCKNAAIAGSKTGTFFLDACRTLYKLLPSGKLTRIRKAPLAGTLAVDGSGNFYISDLYSTLKIRPNGKASYLTRSIGGRIAADTSGNVYAGEYNAGLGTLYVVNPNGNVRALRSNLGMIEGVGIDPTGNAYVTSIGRSKVYRVSPRGTEAPFGSSAPFMVAIDAQSNLYVAD